MFSISDMKYKAKLGLMAGASAAGIILLAIFSLTTMNKVEVGSDLYTKLQLDNDVQTNFTPAHGALDEIRLTGLRMEDPSNRDQIPALVEQARKDETNFQETYVALKKRAAINPKLSQMMEGPAYTIGKQYYEQFNANYLPLIQKGQFEAARNYRVNNLVPLYTQQQAAVDEIISYANDRAKENEAATASAVTSGTWTIVVVGLIVLFAVCTLSLLISKHINQQIGKLQVAAQALADGDMTHRIEAKSGDELGDVGRSMNDAFEKVGAAVRDITTHSETIASASEELSSSATQIAASAETQKEQSSQVATAMQEMSSTVMQVSDNSNQAAESARHAGDLAKNGGKIVTETVKVIQEVAVSTRDTAEKMEELNKSSDQIGKIINTIDDIADQTNLLALNAAIEAARAGDQGRGFAVVADEVRKLAERTSGATKEIASMIQTIQEETKKAVEAMRNGTTKVDAGVTSANKAGEALQQIIENADNLQDMITHIATAATEQSAATEQVNTNMEQIAKMVEQSSIGASESAKACQSLSDLALDLQQVVSKFKIAESEHSVSHRKQQRTAQHAQGFLPASSESRNSFGAIQ